MKQSIQFMFDGISSEDMGVHIAWNDDGLFEENFLPNRKIVEKKIANREKPYFQRVENEPLSFSLSFAIADWEDKETLRKLARWLFQPHYKPIVFDSNPNRVFYVILEGDSSLFHNGLNEGYIEIELRCDSPYGYTHEQTKENTKFRNSNTGKAFSDNLSTFENGSLFNIKNTSNGLTIDTVLTTWGMIYATAKYWGELD